MNLYISTSIFTLFGYYNKLFDMDHIEKVYFIEN